MTPKIKIISAIALLILTFAAVFNYIMLPKIAFVDTAKVFNGFTMKKNLETEFKKIESMRKSQLDSMQLMITVIQKEPGLKNKEEILDYKIEELERKRQEFLEANESLSQKYNEQIWSQLNQYVKDYGSKRGYDFIHGTMGDGNLMYASDKKDITNDVLDYVNKSYNGVSN